MLSLGVYIAAGVLFYLIVLLLIIKSRYHTFTSRDYVLFFRRGALRTLGYGGGYFVLPLIDRLVAFTVGTCRVDFTATQEIVFKPKFNSFKVDKKIDQVVIKGFLLFKVKDPKEFFTTSRSVAESGKMKSKQLGDTLIQTTQEDLADLIESYLRNIILEKSLDSLYHNRSELTSQIRKYISSHMERYSLEEIELRITEFNLE